MRSIDLWTMKRNARKAGLRVVGNFLIVSYTRDVISGFAMDPAPSSIYVWTFALPVYDGLPHLHMSLGQRVACPEDPKDFFRGTHEAHLAMLEGVRTAADLLMYVEEAGFEGDYCQWVKYLSTTRLGDFPAADAALKNLLALPVSSAIRGRLDRMLEAIGRGGESGARQLLQEWSMQTARLMGGSSTFAWSQDSTSA
ncbi:transmembrane protein [Stenotrophomonas maltophilia]|nr:transmembrane protein [Stenotrophomonas maltophilia]